jgi:hypothetical protein
MTVKFEFGMRQIVSGHRRLSLFLHRNLFSNAIVVVPANHMARDEILRVAVRTMGDDAIGDRIVKAGRVASFSRDATLISTTSPRFQPSRIPSAAALVSVLNFAVAFAACWRI